jgi:hypothetical protein
MAKIRKTRKVKRRPQTIPIAASKKAKHSLPGPIGRRRLLEAYRNAYERDLDYRKRIEMLTKLSELGPFDKHFSKRVYEVCKIPLKQSNQLVERLIIADVLGNVRGPATKDAARVLIETLKGEYEGPFKQPRKELHTDHLRRNAAISLKRLCIQNFDQREFRVIVPRILKELKIAREERRNQPIRHIIDQQIREIEAAWHGLF